MKIAYLAIPLAIAGFSLDGCADMGLSDAPSRIRVAERIEYGVVESIDLHREGDKSPVGAVLGDRARVVNDRVSRA